VNTHQQLVDRYPQLNQHEALKLTSELQNVVTTSTREDLLGRSDDDVRGLMSRVQQATQNAGHISPQFKADVTQVLVNLTRKFKEKRKPISDANPL
jgi:ABC-type transporter Mla subunit MlaD